MASLPITLTYGYVSVYGTGVSNWGLFDKHESMRTKWGIIDQLSVSAPATLAIGDTVIYNKEDVLGTIFYNQTEFNLMKWKNIIAVENVYALP